jgi:hypothetical protein
MPSFKKGLTKGTETPWTRRKVTAGRLICDTYFAAKVQNSSFISFNDTLKVYFETNTIKFVEEFDIGLCFSLKFVWM